MHWPSRKGSWFRKKNHITPVSPRTIKTSVIRDKRIKPTLSRVLRFLEPDERKKGVNGPNTTRSHHFVGFDTFFFFDLVIGTLGEA